DAACRTPRRRRTLSVLRREDSGALQARSGFFETQIVFLAGRPRAGPKVSRAPGLPAIQVLAQLYYEEAAGRGFPRLGPRHLCANIPVRRLQSCDLPVFS